MILSGIRGQAWLALVSVLMLAVACSKMASLNEAAYVVPEKLKLRSSTAQASRVVGEVKAGDRITITTRSKAEDGTPWVNIKSGDGQAGWAETRYFVKEEIVNKSRQMAESIRSIPTQALGKSKASLKLRLTPDRINEDNVATTLPSGTVLEIVARERKLRPASVDGKPENAQPAAQNAKNADADVKYDAWFQVRLKDYAVLPAGWIYGGSVELDVPPEIIYFVSTKRKIMGWQKIGTARGDDNKTGDHYLVLERKVTGADDNSDFDLVKVLAYDPRSRNYNTPFRDEVLGRFPLTLTMNGQQGTFRVNAIGKDGQKQELEYGVEVLSAPPYVKIARPNVPKATKKTKK